MVYVSLSARIRFDVEALNMVESVGNYVRRRKAPIIIESPEGYRIEYVPAISGESIAHAYQENLAKLAELMGLPVCKWCKEGTFVKHSDDSYFIGFKPKENNKVKKPREIEEHIIKTCVVEDVGGFLYPAAPAKRTSRISFGYLIPVRDAIKAVAVEPEFHVRYEPEQTEMQAIYNVEVATAIYGLKAELNVDGIGKSSLSEELIVSEDERVKRIEAAIKALAVTIGSVAFGAKKTRFFPADWEILNAVVAISHPVPFTASSPRIRDYIQKTIERAESMKKHLNAGEARIQEEIFIGIYGGDAPKSESAVVLEKLDTFEELMTWTLEKVLNYYKQ